MKDRMRIAITMGDPAGIGSEIVVRALAREEVYKQCIPIVVGDREALQDALRFCKMDMILHPIEMPTEAQGYCGTIDCIDLGYLKSKGWRYKENSALCGDASFHYVTRAIRMAMDKEVFAVVTAPINKESLNMAGHHYSGHTEIFAEYTNTPKYAMLLASGNLRVIHVSTHCALREACERVKKKRVLEVIELAKEGLRLLGISTPKIAVAGLNPHASEKGLFGKEEQEEIEPAIHAARELGIDVSGPEPPDTVFVKCRAGMYDIVVAMYHDQGHIPLKFGGFEMDKNSGKYTAMSGINCTIGLPIIRTSVDHGTAFGKAGEGRANEESMLDAIFAGIEMAKNKFAI